MAGLTLRTILNPKRNSLNAVRLLLALSVIVSHSFAIGMFGPEPQAGGARLGTWAVLGFFTISGFLITGSRMSGKPVVEYYANRVMRIFPGFVVCLVVVAFAFAPLSLLIDKHGSLTAWNSITYFLRNLALYPPELAQPAIGQTLQNVPYKGYWNGSMWTLFWEFACYVLIGVAASVVTRKHLPKIVLALFAASTVLSAVVELGMLNVPDLGGRALPLLASFAAGALAFLYQDKIKFSLLTIATSAVALAVVIMLGMVSSFAPAPLAFLVLWLGAVLPVSRVGSKVDLSYGLYIYAWPMQQVLMVVFGQALGLWAMIILSIAATVPLAYLSFRYVEKPAQVWGRQWLKGLATKRGTHHSVPSAHP